MLRCCLANVRFINLRYICDRRNLVGVHFFVVDSYGYRHKNQYGACAVMYFTKRDEGLTELIVLPPDAVIELSVPR